MVLKMYSIFDRKTLIHQPPCYCHNTAHVIRVLGGLFSDPKQVYFAHAADFQVFEVGEFDDQTAVLTALPKPHLVCSGPELVGVLPAGMPAGQSAEMIGVE